MKYLWSLEFSQTTRKAYSLLSIRRITRLNESQQSRQRDQSLCRMGEIEGETGRDWEGIDRSTWNLHRAIKLHARGRASGYVSILCQTMDDPAVLFGKPVYTARVYGYYFMVILTNRCNRVYVRVCATVASTCTNRTLSFISFGSKHTAIAREKKKKKNRFRLSQ